MDDSNSMSKTGISDGNLHATTFLSHSSKDSPLAHELCAALEARGIPCWIAPRDLRIGESWALGCVHGLEECNSFLLLASDHALASEEVISEVALAHRRRKSIYTVLVPPAKVRGEIDFYLSRLHWLNSGGRTVEELAAVLAESLKHDRRWKAVSEAPSLKRTMRWRPVAFARLAAGVCGAIVAIVLAGGAGLLALNRALDRDFRRLAYIDLADSADGDRTVQVHGQVWLMAKGVAFREVRLAASSDVGNVALVEPWVMPEQVGSMEPATIVVDRNATRLTTCLTVPSPGLHAPYRVTQAFALRREGDAFRIAETMEKRVSREDGSLCGARNDSSGKVERPVFIWEGE